MKKTINKKLVESLKKINQKERDFRFAVNITPDLSITFGLISTQQDIASQKYSKAVAPDNKEEYDEIYSTECFLWAIKSINGEEIDQAAPVETDRVDEAGKPEMVEFHKYLRDEIISNWSRETLNNIRGIVNIKTTDWSVQATKEIKTSDGLSVLDLMKNLTDTITKPVPTEAPISVPNEAAPVPQKITANPSETNIPPKPLPEYPKSGEFQDEGGALDDPYKTGAASPTTLEEVRDRLVATEDAKFDQISRMEGLDYPPERMAPAGFQVGGDTIPPYSGPEGVNANLPSVQERREVQRGGISSKSEPMDANAIERYKRERQRGK